MNILFRIAEALPTYPCREAVLFTMSVLPSPTPVLGGHAPPERYKGPSVLWS